MFQPALKVRTSRGPAYFIKAASTPTYLAMLMQVSGPGDGYTYFPDFDAPGSSRVSRRTLKAQQREAEIWDDSSYAMSYGYISDSPLFIDTYVEGRAEGRYENEATRVLSCNGEPATWVTWAGITTCSHCAWVTASPTGR